MSNTIQKLYSQGQSIWCDDLSRRMIDSGELHRLIDLGVVGVTSNPTIFMKSITGSTDYDRLFDELLGQGCDLGEVYEGLVLRDIADAADRLRGVYDRTGGADGFVSLEVNPKLAYDTDATVAEARRLFAHLNRPNVLIKVPATQDGIPAIETLIGEGVNVNVTLIFSLAMYDHVVRAYLNGLKKLGQTGGDLSQVASVASFFVSRVDTLVDEKLKDLPARDADVGDLSGRAAIANAKLAYVRFEEVFHHSREFSALADLGARVQRPLWASTSTKNPAYPPTKYVDGLVAPCTVNTLPPATIEATLQRASTAVAIHDQLPAARTLFQRLAQVGIDMEAVSDRLLVNGVRAFARSFDELLAALERKREALRTAG